MKKEIKFEHNQSGNGRPQILLMGNGLEYDSGQPSWNQLIEDITVKDSISLTEEEKKSISFPLLYNLLSTSQPVPKHFTEKDFKQILSKLSDSMKKLNHQSNSNLDLLPTIGLDHVFTTNYSYCLESAFQLKGNFNQSGYRSRIRFNLNEPDENGKVRTERVYRLHSGYLAKNEDGSKVGLWYIHGEVSVVEGIVLGHDIYGRLLSRIETICSNQKYDRHRKHKVREFRSWPELFLYGDVYILGFGFEQCEFDLWWLLRRKQRETYSDGKVYYYDFNKTLDTKKKMLMSHGVQIVEIEQPYSTYNEFYTLAIEDIKKKVEKTYEKIS